MSKTIACFLLEPIAEAEESLRRFCFSKEASCPARLGFHNAEVKLGVVPWDKTGGRGADDFDHADSRWPTHCSCGYAFKPEDQWQHNLDQLYARSDTGEKVSLDNAPPGAMWYADWFGTARSPDGRVLVLRTPGGDWNIDSKSSNGSGWTRTGVPPKVTANPSIICGRRPDGQWEYHGWLTNGELREV